MPEESLENLTRDEARERARILEIASYDVSVDLSGAVGDAATFTSTSVVRFTCSEPGASVHVDITADSLTSATLNGEQVDTSSYDGKRLSLPALAADNELAVTAECLYMRTGEGMHRFVDPADKETYLYTQFEPFDAHRVFACFDQPDLKATFAFTVDVPREWVVVSNMPGETEKGRWVFPATPRQSSYITAIVAGPYHSVQDSYDGIPLGLYCRQSLAEHLDAEDLFEVTKQGFAFFHEKFGRRYAWPKYDQCFVAEYNAGAMENAGCVTILDDYVFRSRTTDAAYERRDITILHELAHMWFGDLVTMRWWDDLWLNESFAEWVSTLAAATVTRWSEAWTTFCTTEKTWAYRQDQLPTTHPIASDTPDIESVFANFDGITYAKGASVLKQLAHYVGVDAFLAGLRDYFDRHAYSNTTFQDLLDAATRASGRDLAEWAKEWIQTAGLNTMRPEISADADGVFTAFAIRQEAPSDHPTLRNHVLRVGLFDLDGGALRRRDSVEVEVSGALTAVPMLVGVRQPDLVLLNDHDLAYTKIRLDERSWRTALDHLGDLDDSLARALCWGAAWDMTRDGERAPGDYVSLVLSAVGRERDINSVQIALSLARQAIDPLGDPALRDERMTRYAAAMLELLDTAESQSDLQLAYARAFAASATSPDQLAVVAALRDGSRTVGGLTVDRELGWQLLSRLVVMGAAGAEEIDRELAQDETFLGRRNATRLRAAIPAAQAKEAAWAALTGDSRDLANTDSEEIIRGFAPQEQQQLTAPYVDRFFAEVRDLYASRTQEIATQIATGLFPYTHVSDETVARADAWLAANSDAPPGLHRAILEGRDTMARALHCQARDTH